MKKLHFWMVVFLWAGAGALYVPSGARAAVQKSPGDAAAAEFTKVRDESTARPDGAHFQKLIAAGIAFLTEYPTHDQAPAVIRGLATFGATIPEKSQASLRAVWLARLKYEALSQRQKADLSDDARAAIVALEAAAAGAEARAAGDQTSLDAYREKIDALAQLPSGGRFLAEQEFGYVQLLKATRMSAAEAQLKRLREHPDKKIAAMAVDELNLIEIGKQPFELKFTALDGREVDFAQLRGKVVLLCFWSTTNDRAVQEQTALPLFYNTYRQRGFEIVGVSCDKAEDREKVAKFVKKNDIAWPQYFDGQELKGELAGKLNVRALPVSFLFDQKGMLVGGKAVVTDQLNTVVKRLLGIK